MDEIIEVRAFPAKVQLTALSYTPLVISTVMA
jgi:hypothetical protein